MRLLRYPWGANLGDTLQSFVFERYMRETQHVSHIDYVGRDFPWSRETSLENFTLGDSVKDLVVTGWLTQNPSHFLHFQQQIMGMVGIHITDGESNAHGNFGFQHLFLSETFRSEFSGHKVSSRDSFTSEFLAEYGFNAPFVGCVSSLISMIDLSWLPKLQPIDILYVDFDPTLIDSFKDSSRKNLKIHKDTNKISEFTGELEKERLVKNLLARIISAEFIITSRLHVALPAIALGKKTLLISNKDSRFGEIEKFLNVMSPDEAEVTRDLNELISRTELKPLHEIGPMQMNLKNQIQEIHEPSTHVSKITPKIDYERQVLSEISAELLNEVHKMSGSTSASINRLETSINRLERELTEIKNSNSWRVTAPIRFLTDKVRSISTN